jgi:hypothetical protein
LFTSLGWDVENSNVFDRFCNTLTFFNPIQQDFLIDFTSGFLKVGIEKYYYHIQIAFNKIVDPYLNNINQIYILPLNKGEEYGVIDSSSSDSLSYLFRNSELVASGLFAKYLFEIKNKPANLPIGFPRINDMLLVVDDFIGTGAKASDCYNYLVDKIGIDPTKVIILTLAIQKQGYEKLLSQKINVTYSIIRDKAISSLLDNNKKNYYTEIMTSIEDVLKISDDYRFGFLQCEALIKMINIPNDTFPVYWVSKKKINSTSYIPPFIYE